VQDLANNVADVFPHNELGPKHTHIQPKFMRPTTSRNTSSSPLHSGQLRTSTSDRGVFDSSVSGFRGLPSDNKATTTSAIQDVDASITSIVPAAPSSTAYPLSDSGRGDATTTLSRRKDPEAFESAARLRESICSKYFTKKGFLGPSVYSAEELVLIHKAAKAQIQELKNIEAENRESVTELQKENANLQRQSRDLDHALNKRIANEDKIVNERCASREQMSDGLLRDNASDVSTLRREIIRLKARVDDAPKEALREIEILQQQRDDAREELRDVKKKIQSMQKRSKTQQAAKPRPERASRNTTSSTISGTNPAIDNTESTSEEGTTPPPRLPTRALLTRSLRSSASPYTINGPMLDDTDLNNDPSSDSYDIPSSSPYKPPNAKKRKLGAVDLESFDVDKAGGANDRGTDTRLGTGRFAGGSEHKESFAPHDAIDQRDQEAIREARGLRGRTSKRT